MRTVILLFPLLLTCIPLCVSDFKLLPQGDGITLAVCKITIGNDSYFSSTVPYLKRGQDGRVFEFVNAWDELGPGFHGDHYPDTNLLFATLTIRGDKSADLEENLICFATLYNDTVMQYPLLMEERESYLCHTNRRNIVIAASVPTTILILSGIVIAIIFGYRCRKRKQSYQIDVSHKQHSPASSYHTARHDMSMEVIQTEVEDIQDAQESEKTKYWTK